MPILLILLVLFSHHGTVWAAPARQPQLPEKTTPSERRVEIVDYGIYTAEVVREEMKGASPSGKTNYISDIKLLRKTDRVPAVIGTRFGMRFVVRGGAGNEVVPLKAKILYPGLRPPGSEEPLYSTEDDIYVPAGEVSFEGILLEFDWGLVPGKWTFQIFHGDRLMAEKSFEVFRPEP